MKKGTGIQVLKGDTPGNYSLFWQGPSGVGKSSLLNKIQPGLSLQTGASERQVSKGAPYHPACTAIAGPEGLGYVADTPGFSRLNSAASCFREDLSGLFPRDGGFCCPMPFQHLSSRAVSLIVR
ncbi:MAG: GTPase RsgA [Bacillota bacterium]